jgi:hypothetical protein
MGARGLRLYHTMDRQIVKAGRCGESDDVACIAPLRFVVGCQNVRRE